MMRAELHTEHSNGLIDRSLALYPTGTPLQDLRDLDVRRRGFMKGKNRLLAQAFAGCMALTAGDKDEARKLLAGMEKAVAKGAGPGEVDAYCFPFLIAAKMLDEERATAEKEMARVVKKLAVWESWAEGVLGVGALSVAKILAGTGDLGQYANPAKVWKRMGLALVGDERQRKCADAEKAAAHGYNPQRRSDMYVLTDSMVKHVVSGAADKETGEVLTNEHGEPMSRPKTPYGEYYVGEIERQRDKLRGQAGYKMAAMRRAQRHLAKRILRDLWRAWRDCGGLEGKVSG